jgi:isoquinoline 1-oxidoreductase beta subunit
MERLLGPPRVLHLNLPNYPSETGYPLYIGRLLRVTEMAAEKGGWGKLPQPMRRMCRNSGIALGSNSEPAPIAKLTFTEKGDIRIPRIDTVVDAGTAVNPANIRAQFECRAALKARKLPRMVVLLH